MIDIEAIEKAYQKAKVADETAGIVVVNQEAFDFLTAASATWPQIRRELEAGRKLRYAVLTMDENEMYASVQEALAQYDRSGT